MFHLVLNSEIHFIGVQSHGTEMRRQEGVGAALWVLSVNVGEMFGSVGGCEVH